MTLALRAISASFTKFIGYAAMPYSVVDGMVGCYLFGSNGSLDNRAPAGGAALSLIGTPTVNSNSFVGSKTIGYDTGLPDSADFTFIAVAKKISGTGSIIGNLNNVATDADVGSTLGQFAGSFFQTAPVINTTSGVSKAMTGSVGDLCFFAGTVSGNVLTAYFGRANSLDSVTYTGGSRYLDSAETIKIAAHNYSGIYPDSNEIYLAGIHNVGLSGAQIAAVYQDIRTYCASIGLPGL